MHVLFVAIVKWIVAGFSPRSIAGLRQAAPSLFAWAGAALVLLAFLLWWQPFRVRIPGGVMTVSECGANMAQIRSETLEKAHERQRDMTRSVEAERDQLAVERDAARQNAAVLAEALETLRRDEAKRPAGSQMCLPADLVRKWNKGAYR